MDTVTATTLEYQSGFGNEFASEALPGALPDGRNSPQRAPYGLYAELVSGTAFTQPRADNLRTWVYRMRPSAVHGGFRQVDNGSLRTPPSMRVCSHPSRCAGIRPLCRMKKPI